MRNSQYQDFHAFIITATLQLLEERPLANLPVTAIVKRAGVSRQAFYRHFQSKEDVLQAHFEPIYGNFLTNLAQTEELDRQKVAEQLCDFFASQAEELKKAAQSGYSLLIFQIFKAKIAQFYNETTTWTDYTGTKRQWWNDFMAAGLFEVLGTWAREGCQTPKSEVIKMIIEFHE